MKRPSKVMMVDNVLALVWPENHRDEVFAEELRSLLLSLVAPTRTPLSDLAHSHGDLRRMQLCDSGGPEDGVADDSHDRLPTGIFDV
jgi:hypothetical protein